MIWSLFKRTNKTREISNFPAIFQSQISIIFGYKFGFRET